MTSGRVANVLIQGSSRGIGLQFCRSLLARQVNVIATCRQPNQAEELQQLKSQQPDRLHILRVDVTDETDIIVIAIDMFLGNHACS